MKASEVDTCPPWSQQWLEDSTVKVLPAQCGISSKLCLPLRLLVGLFASELRVWCVNCTCY